jgi:hypothetical protein
MHQPVATKPSAGSQRMTSVASKPRPINMKNEAPNIIVKQEYSEPEIGDDFHDTNIGFDGSDDMLNEPIEITEDVKKDEQLSQPEPAVVKKEILPAAPLKTANIKIAKKSQKGKSAYLPKFQMDDEMVSLDEKKVNLPEGVQDWHDVRHSISTQGDAKNTPIEVLGNDAGHDFLEENGSLRMFWFDAFEKDGKVYVFGKVKLNHLTCF